MYNKNQLLNKVAIQLALYVDYATIYSDVPIAIYNALDRSYTVYILWYYPIQIQLVHADTDIAYRATYFQRYKILRIVKNLL